MSHARELALSLTSGGTARCIATDGESVTLLCSRAFPPGSPLAGTAIDGSGTYHVKVRATRKTGDDPEHPYRIEGRFMNLSRSQRSTLVALGAQTID